MRLAKSAIAAAAFSVAALSYTPPASANANDAIIAGAAGFAIGTLFGNATATPRYYAPRPVYVAPPVYAAPPVYVPPPTAVYYAPAPWTAQWYSYCAAKYRSFDPRSGTFAGFDGYRHICR